MERIIGKYTLNVTSEEINKDNFFKHSVSVLKPEFIYIDKSELSLWLAQTFRYSNDEKGIDILYYIIYQYSLTIKLII